MQSFRIPSKSSSKTVSGVPQIKCDLFHCWTWNRTKTHSSQFETPLEYTAQRRTTMSTTADPVDTLSQTKAHNDRRPAVHWTRAALHKPRFFSAEARPSPTATKTSFCLWADRQQKDAECFISIADACREDKDKTILRGSVWKHIHLFWLNQRL